jgi:hypothetical protein
LALAALLPATIHVMLYPDARWRSVLVRLAIATLAVASLYAAVHGVHRAVATRLPLHGIQTVVQQRAGWTWHDQFRAIGALVDFGACGVADLAGGPLLRLEPAGLVAGAPRPAATAHVATASRVLFLAWLASFALCLRRQTRLCARQAIGLGVLALASYGIVAAWIVLSGRIAPLAEIASMTGADLDASIWDSQIRAERYHYLPPLLLMMATVRVLPSLAMRTPLARRLIVGAALTWTTLLVVSNAVALRARRTGWVPTAIVEHQLRNAVAGAPDGATVYVENGQVPIPFASKDTTLPGRAAIALLLFPDGMVDGRRVYFVEHDAALLDALRAPPLRPIARLVVSPTESGSAAVSPPR